MKKAAAVAVAVLTASIAPLGACTKQNISQPNTSPLTVTPPGAEKMTTQLKSADETVVANATLEFANGYATVTVEAGPNQVLAPGFHGLQIHSVGKCEADFNSAGEVFQAPDHSGYPASGELTALQVRPDGAAKLVTTTSAFTAAELKNGSGTALIIHQDPDTLGSSPPGDSGKRVACGVISAGTTATSSSMATTTVTTTTAAPPPSTSTSTVTVTSAPTVTSSPTTTATTPPSLPPGT